MPDLTHIVAFGLLPLRAITGNPVAIVDMLRNKRPVMTIGERQITIVPTYSTQSLQQSSCGSCGSGDMKKSLMIKDVKDAWLSAYR